jgi:hypothetical protein
MPGDWVEMRHDMVIGDEKWGKAKALYLTGMPWEAIGSKLGLRPTTLSQRASVEGITRIKREMDVIAKQTQSLESLSTLVRQKLASDAVTTLERIDNYSLEDIKDESVREQILGSISKRSALVFGWAESGESPAISINLLSSMPDKSFPEISVS